MPATNKIYNHKIGIFNVKTLTLQMAKLAGLKLD